VPAAAIAQDSDDNISPAERAEALTKAHSYIGNGLKAEEVFNIGKHYGIVNWAEDHCDHRRSLWFRTLAMLARDIDRHAFETGWADSASTIVTADDAKGLRAACESMWGFYGKGSKQPFDGALE
jgi:hypothetical protein